MLIKGIKISKPYLLIEKGRKGIILPYTPPKEKKGVKGKKKAKKEKASKKKEEGGPSLKVTVRKLVIKEGEMEFLDRTVHPPARLLLSPTDITVRDIPYPLSEEKVPFVMKGEIPGRSHRGTLYIKGWVVPPTKESNFKVRMRDTEIALFEPYLREKTTVKIKSGLIDLDLGGGVSRSQRLSLRGTAIIRDLGFAGPGGGSFLGIPATLITALMKDAHGRIEIPLEIEGDLKRGKSNWGKAVAKAIGVGMQRRIAKMPKELLEAPKGVLEKGVDWLKKLPKF